MPLEWLAYPRATGILRELEDIVEYGGSGIWLLAGPPNNGKTTILDRLLRNYPVSVDRSADRTRIPILGLHAPPRPALGRFLKSALAKTGALVFGGDRPTMMSYLATILERIGTRILAVDDAQNVLAGARWEQQEFWAGLRELAERARVSLLLIGTLELFQLERLLPTTHFLPLPAWPLDDGFREMIRLVERRVSGGGHWDAAVHAATLHRLTEGRLGELIALVTTLRNEAGTWDCRRLEQWIPPSERFACLDDVL
jgi:hypothetical protein